MQIFTPEQLAEIDAYHFPFYVWEAVSDAVHLGVSLVIILWLVGPLFRWAASTAVFLEARLGGLRRAPVARVVCSAFDRLWGEPGWGAAILFAVYQYLLVRVVYLPLHVYFSYVLEHRFGLSRYTPFTFAVDELKSTAMAMAAIVALAFGVFALARRVKRWWLVLGVVAGLALTLSAALDPYRAQVFFKQRPLEQGPLRQKITALMQRAHVAFADVVVEENARATITVQAYFAGQGPTRTVVLNDALLQGMTDDEVLAVVAHESAHVAEQRWLGRVASPLALLAFLFLVDRLWKLAAARRWLGTTGFADIRTLPLVTLLFYVLIGLAQPLSAAYSRESETKADLFALRLTHDPDSFKGMLVKAARINKMDPSPPRWLVLKGLTHPPVADRIAAVERGDWKN